MKLITRSMWPLALIAGLPAILLGGCRRHHDDADTGAPTPVVARMRSALNPPDSLRAGDVRIVTVDSSIDLALLGDTISTGLSPYALNKVRHETDTASVNGSGFAASIEKMVKGAVAGAVGTRAAFPLTAVRDVRYDNGRLQFDWAGRPVNLFEHTKVNGRPVLEAFRPEDAQRFVDAVRARKRAGAVRP